MSHAQPYVEHGPRSVLIGKSIIEAMEKASKYWEGTRGKKSQQCQARQALNTIFEVISSSLDRAELEIELEDITIPVVQRCVERWKKEGKSPSTINARLSTLRVLGIKTEGCWARDKLPPKWWLRPSEQSRLLAYLRAPTPPFANAPLLADYLEFISYTGLRVEEALRLTWRDVTLILREEGGVVESDSEITVPGTKTQGSRATLYIGVQPTVLLLKRKNEATDDAPTVFPINYSRLHMAWDKARAFLGDANNRMATLKAMRRAATRHLTTNGMPTEMVRDYLRHSNIKTTMGYLHLVGGGYSTKEQRKFLS